MKYIKKVAEKELWNSGKVELWDLSRCNTNEESRIECISQIASVCYGKPPKDAKRLVERLRTESGGKMSSAFEFIRGCDCEECDDIGIDSSLRNFTTLPTDEEWAERRGYEVEEVSGWHRGAVATFRLTVPIFIARQVMRHRQFSYQELSRRYTTDGRVPLEFWYDPRKASLDFAAVVREAVAAYRSMLDRGVRPEAARAVLPQSLYTTLWMQGDVPAWKNYFKLRLDERTQKEHRELARAMLDLLKGHQPELYEKVKP